MRKSASSAGRDTDGTKQRDGPIRRIGEKDRKPDKQNALFEPRWLGHIGAHGQRPRQKQEKIHGGAKLPHELVELGYRLGSALRREPVVSIRQPDPAARQHGGQFRREIQADEHQACTVSINRVLFRSDAQLSGRPPRSKWIATRSGNTSSDSSASRTLARKLAMKAARRCSCLPRGPRHRLRIPGGM